MLIQKYSIRTVIEKKERWKTGRMRLGGNAFPMDTLHQMNAGWGVFAEIPAEITWLCVCQSCWLQVSLTAAFCLSPAVTQAKGVSCFHLFFPADSRGAFLLLSFAGAADWPFRCKSLSPQSCSPKMLFKCLWIPSFFPVKTGTDGKGVGEAHITKMRCCKWRLRGSLRC